MQTVQESECKQLCKRSNHKNKNEVGNDKLIIGVSGGVDSTVAAALIHKAIGSQSTAVLIDHGLMRKNEAKTCVSALKKD